MSLRTFTLLLGVVAVLPFFSRARGDDFGPAAEALEYGNRWALVIGINYEGADAVTNHFIKPLKTAEKDALAVADVLEKNYGFNVTRLIGKEATREAISDKLGHGFLGQKKKVTPKDCVLIYYAGHGDRRDAAQKGDFVGLLYPYTVQFDDGEVVKDSCIRLSELRELLRTDCYARHKLLVLDSCYSGQVFGTGTRAAAGLGPGINPRSFREPVFWGLASARGDQEAQDGKDHSPFAEALLGTLTGADGAPISGARLVAAIEARLSDQLRGKNQDALGLRLNGTTGEIYLFPRAGAVPAQKPAADLLVSMPGLYGRWWFQETPWLVPGLREGLAAGADPIDFYSPGPASRNGGGPPGPKRLSDDVKAIYKATQARFDAMVSKHDVDVPDHVLLLRSLSKQMADRSGDRARLERIDKALDAYAQGHPTASVFHASAALKHLMGRAPEAKALYEKARLAYAKPAEGAPPSGAPGEAPRNEPLALCLDDYGRLRNELLGEFELACRDFQVARSYTRNPLLVIESLCNEADALRNLHQFDDAEGCLNQALAVAPKNLGANHPLLAYLHDRYAWVYMERWELKKALAEFRKAKDVWTADRGADPTRAVFALDESHGVAMAQRFLGSGAAAQTTFNDLLRDAERLINGRSQPAYLSVLQLRRANSLERKADAALFVPKPRLEPAADGYEEAIDAVDSAPRNMQPRLKAKLLYKWAIALAMLGRAVDANDALTQTDAVSAEIKKDLAVLAAVARAEVDLAAKPEDTAPLAALRDVVKDALSNKDQKVDRDTLEILLSVTGQLLASDRLAGKSSVMLKDADLMFKLATVACERCGPGHDILPFLRDFLDQAIDACVVGNEKPRWLCEYIIKANLGHTAAGLTDDSPDLAFHFAEEGGNGIAVLFEPETSTGRVVPLGLSLEALKAGKFAARPPLPRPLAEALAKVHGPVQVYWADDVLGLDDASFPFDRGAFDLRLPSEEQAEGADNGKP